MVKVNGTQVHAVYKKMETLHHCKFAAEGLIFLLLVKFHVYKVNHVAVWYKLYSSNEFFQGFLLGKC